MNLKTTLGYGMENPKEENDNFIIILTFTEVDLLKFHTKRLETYACINPDRVVVNNVNTFALPSQQGIASFFSLYMEILVSQDNFNLWLQDLKIKNKIIV